MNLYLIIFFEEMLKEILRKIDTILNEPTQSSADLIKMALEAIDDGEAMRARELFNQATLNAVRGDKF